MDGHEAHLGHVPEPLDEPGLRDAGHADDVAIPVRQVAWVRDHLPNPLGGGRDLDVDGHDIHRTETVPLDQPRHHTRLSGLTRTTAASPGPTPASRATAAADRAPLASPSSTKTSPRPRAMAPTMFRARHHDGRSATRAAATLGAPRPASASVGSGSTAYRPAPETIHVEGSATTPSSPSRASTPFPRLPRSSRISLGSAASGSAPVRTPRNRSCEGTDAPQAPQERTTMSSRMRTDRSTRSSAKTRPGGGHANGTR